MKKTAYLFLLGAVFLSYAAWTLADEDIILDSGGTTEEEAVAEEMVESQVVDLEEEDSEKNNKEEKIIINEIAWMGMPTSTSDEWIELYNKSDNDVDLEGWALEVESSSDIKLKGKIKAGDFFLLEKTDDNSVPNVEAGQVYSGKISLNNKVEKLTLKNNKGVIADKVDALDGWPAGNNEEKRTMEKTDKGWQTSFIIGGTPGKENSKKTNGNEGEDDNGDNNSNEEIIYSDKIVINEVFPNPAGDDLDKEWVEIFCSDENEIDLEGWMLKDKAGNKYVFKNTKIKSKEYLVVQFSGLNNNNEELFLYNPANESEPVSLVFYDKTQEDFSYTRDDKGNYVWTDILTPGSENEFPQKKEYPDKIFFNEIMNNPDGVDKNNEWVELYNDNSFSVDLDEWKIINGAGKSFVIKSIEITAKSLAVVNIIDNSFTLRNSDESLTLTDPNGKLVDEIKISGDAKQGSSYNKSTTGTWDWSRFITSGKNNKLNNLPKIKIKESENVYKGIKAEFDSSNTSDTDKDELKFRWDFGDGHYSYLENTSHKYEKNGKYKIILRVDDGSSQVFKEFDIEVESYPDYDIKIIRLLPNPIGVDNGSEEIEIENNSNKKINLKDWKIATGSDKSKIVNHPVYEDVFVEAGKTIVVKNIDCHFSLPNKKGVVVLRYPNDEDADKVKYEKEKIEDGEEYMLMENGWIWVGGSSASLSIDSDAETDVLGVSTSLLNNFLGGFNPSEIWQTIMSDEINKRTMTMRGLLAFNWLLRERMWYNLTGVGFY